ncbi:hypothetical protein HBI10_148370 [Parastagonospora nodorum]|nr:hypothetical protein HBI10_148370 [Parastagonospora nodorum]
MIPLLSLELHQLLMHRAGRILRLGEGRSISRKRQSQGCEGELHLGGWTVEQCSCVAPLALHVQFVFTGTHFLEAPGRMFLEIIYSGWALEYCIGSLAELGSSVYSDYCRFRKLNHSRTTDAHCHTDVPVRFPVLRAHRNDV